MITFRQPFRGSWPITQRYGETITSSFHTGIDYGTPENTPILASASGQVMAAGWDSTGYGFRVIIRHTADRSTLYAHLSSFCVIQGELVDQGDVIGYSGNSGNTTGPHLHFEARTQWSNYKTHFDPLQLPLMSFADADPQQPAETSQNSAETSQKKEIRAGTVRVICSWPANVRSPYDHSRINGQKLKGDTFEITDGVIRINGLPYHRIIPRHVDDLGGLIAEYDAYGTQILEQVT